MNKILITAMISLILSGCGEKTASDTVLEFMNTENTALLSSSKIEKCTPDGIKNIILVNKNSLPTTNDYYQLSSYLYGKSKYSVISEKKEGDSYVVSVKWVYPKVIDDAQSFIEADNPRIGDDDKKELDNLKLLYENGELENLEYAEDITEWVVLPDGIDPKLSAGNIEACSK
ncbi:hypothetical protein ACMFGU_12545 [Morganella morganii]|uniref:hypothetical protein n=1 Tax=Morganella morganii TaxID=582 RepID=UPI003CF29648